MTKAAEIYATPESSLDWFHKQIEQCRTMLPEIQVNQFLEIERYFRQHFDAALREVERLKAIIGDCDYIAFDNSDPPQLWAWAGPRDESGEPLPVRPLAAAPFDALVNRNFELHAEVDRLTSELADLRNQWTLSYEAGLKMQEAIFEFEAERDRLTSELAEAKEKISGLEATEFDQRPGGWNEQ